jgi:hypothetical protein
MGCTLPLEDKSRRGLGIDGALWKSSASLRAGPIDAEKAEDSVDGRFSSGHEEQESPGWKFILIRLKASNRCLIAVNHFLLTPSTMAIRPERQIMVRLLLEMGPHGIVAEHPGKPFLLA